MKQIKIPVRRVKPQQTPMLPENVCLKTQN